MQVKSGNEIGKGIAATAIGLGIVLLWIGLLLLVMVIGDQSSQVTDGRSTLVAGLLFYVGMPAVAGTSLLLLGIRVWRKISRRSL